MKFTVNGVLVVRYSGGWAEYRVNRGRNMDAVIKYFRAKPDFRFAIFHEINKKTKQRIRQVFYFDKNKEKW